MEKISKEQSFLIDYQQQKKSIKFVFLSFSRNVRAVEHEQGNTMIDS